MESGTVLIIDDYPRAIAQGTFLAKLYMLVEEAELGHVVPPPVRVTSHAAGYSTEPDVVAIFWETLQKEKVQFSKTVRRTKTVLVIEGCPDLVVEIVSEGPERPLPHLYAAAGIPEVWIADLRGDDPRLEIHTLRENRYEMAPIDSEYWTRSPLLDRSFRLSVRYLPFDRRAYTLEDRVA
jgi:Uma2 family endonuclease